MKILLAIILLVIIVMNDRERKMSDEKRIEALIDDYASKYAIKHHISKEEAKKHFMCKLAENYYKEENNEDENRSY